MPIAAGTSALVAGGSVISGMLGANAARDAANIQSQTALQVAQMQAQQAQAARDYAERTGREAFNTIGGARDQGYNALQHYGNLGIDTYAGIGKGALDDYSRAVAQYGKNGAQYLSDYSTNARGAMDYLKPYYNTGTNAMQTLGGLYGLQGNAPTSPFNAASTDAFRNSPDYQFALQQGQLGVDRSNAAKGLLISGSQLKDTMQFNQGLASQQFGNYVNRLQSLAGMGQQAGNELTNQGMNYSNNMANMGLNYSGNMANFGGNLANMTSAYGSNLGQMQAQLGNNLATYGLQGATAQGAALTGTNQPVVNALMTGANMTGNSLLAAGQSQASGIVGATNAITGAINTGVPNALLAYKMFGGNTQNGNNNAFNPSSYQDPNSMPGQSIGGNTSYGAVY